MATTEPHTPDPRQAETYLPFVRKVAQRVARRLPQNVDVDELVGAGTIGLMEAIERYDPKGGRSFETYAEFRVKGAIMDDLRRHDPAKRTTRALHNRLQAKKAELANRLGRTPEKSELAAALDMGLEEVEEKLARAKQANIVSIWQENQLPACSRPDQEALYQRAELRQHVREAISQLSDREQIVLDLYYVQELSQIEIGEVLGVSESRICQILSQLREKLRKLLEEHRGGADG
jgi:RNA polymerase sigma factor for flagellar operon FliA